MSDIDIAVNIGKLRFLLTAIKLEKPIKPIRRRVSKKYRKVQEHYLEVIDKYNQDREALKYALQCVIEIVELVRSYQLKELKTDELEKQVNEQRELNIKLYKSFRELKAIMRIAISR